MPPSGMLVERASSGLLLVYMYPPVLFSCGYTLSSFLLSVLGWAKGRESRSHMVNCMVGWDLSDLAGFEIEL
jgi:hypothetical protein